MRCGFIHQRRIQTFMINIYQLYYETNWYWSSLNHIYNISFPLCFNQLTLCLLLLSLLVALIAYLFFSLSAFLLILTSISLKQHFTNTAVVWPLTSHLIRRTRHVGYCWRSKDKLISNVFLWINTHVFEVLANKQRLTYIIGLVWFLCLMVYQPL